VDGFASLAGQKALYIGTGWQAPDRQRLKGKRDRALLALLLACGLRRHEAVALTGDHVQQREEHWAIMDLAGKGGHIRTLPVPDWVRNELNDWLVAASSSLDSLLFRPSASHDNTSSFW
jgi:site-specific recombinase XerD